MIPPLSRFQLVVTVRVRNPASLKYELRSSQKHYKNPTRSSGPLQEHHCEDVVYTLLLFENLIPYYGWIFKISAMTSLIMGIIKLLRWTSTTFLLMNCHFLSYSIEEFASKAGRSGLDPAENIIISYEPCHLSADDNVTAITTRIAGFFILKWTRSTGFWYFLLKV